MDRAPKPLDAELDRDIHTGEARTDQQNTVEFPDCAKGFCRPGIAKIALVSLRIRECQRVAGWEISQRQHYSIGPQATAAAQLDFRRFVSGACERYCHIFDPFQP